MTQRACHFYANIEEKNLKGYKAFLELLLSSVTLFSLSDEIPEGLKVNPRET